MNAQIKKVQAMNQMIINKSNGLSYNEMMHNQEIVEMVAKRDALTQEIDANTQKDMEEFIGENQEWDVILEP